MSSKHLINSVRNSVRESLYGLSKTYSHLKVDLDHNVVFHVGAESEQQKVGIVTGGGSGHEPFPSGYVGSGMISVSVSGSIFASPPSKQILRAIHLAAAKFDEVLIIVPNYTGDVLNFGVAAETAANQGISVERVVVGEDVAQVYEGKFTKAGRRGTCGIVLLSKIAGYMASKGASARDVREKCEEILQDMAALGLCLDACSKPGTGKLFHLNEDELEFGVGVHGEAGIKRMTLTSAEEAVKSLLLPLTSFLKVQNKDETVVLMNNLGSLSLLEQCLVAGEIEKQLTAKGVCVTRLYAGQIFTSLNMNGIQICILKLTERNKELVLKALDHPTTAPAWSYQPPSNSSPAEDIPNIYKVDLLKENELPAGQTISSEKCQVLRKCLEKVSNDLIAAEDVLNRLDSFCGDGDCGSTFRCLGEAFLNRMKANELTFSNPCLLFGQLALCAEENVGGTTGALYGLFFNGISSRLRDSHQHLENPFVYGKCWRDGVEIIKKYSAASLGDRTMLDALEIGCQVYEQALEKQDMTGLKAFEKAVEGARIGCQQTSTMKAWAGRASYTDESKQTEVDAGAMAVTLWLSAILKVIKENYPAKQNQ